MELYPNFEFFNNDGDVSVDALGDASIQSSYWGFVISSVERSWVYRILCQCDSAVCVWVCISVCIMHTCSGTHIDAYTWA